MTTPILISDNNENEKARLNRFLNDPRCADKKVCMVSVAGAFRSGKSFILNFLLRYLRWRRRSCVDKAMYMKDWLDMDKKLTGFDWCGGVDPNTQGILIWPELFLMEDRNGEEVVVILMDTQGLFGSDSTFKNCVTMFALSTMISSVQVFNIQNKIQEDHLQHLQMFTEYARLALNQQDSNTKPFQSLLFLVRDWNYPYQNKYGATGGQQYLDIFLQEKSGLHVELQQLRRDIRASFDNIHCFLMPHPGPNVATSSNFQGEKNQIDPEFTAQLRSLVMQLFHSDNLVVKQINGQPITCRQLADYINIYSEVFRGDILPEPKTIFTATAEACNLALVKSAKAVYKQEMGKVCGGDMPLDEAELRAGHERCRDEAMRVFENAKKMGGPELVAQFVEKLEADIEKVFAIFERSNFQNTVNQEKERADRERDRADRERERADRERERADEERLRANREREKAEREKERAESEKKRADAEKKRADDSCTLL